jgi:ribosomal protein S19E (S16A)
MPSIRDLWQLLQKTRPALEPYFSAANDKLKKTALRGHRGGWLILYISHIILDDVPVTPERIQQIAINRKYHKIEQLASHLQELSAMGLLQKVDRGYCLTQEGQKLGRYYFPTLHDAVRNVNLMPEADIQQLNQLLQRVIDVVPDLPLVIPEYKQAFFNFQQSYDYQDIPPVALFSDWRATLGIVRDATHVPAWEKIGLDGLHIETLSYIWNGKHKTAAALSNVITDYRGYSQDDYQAALDNLTQHRWLEKQGQIYFLSDEGQVIRQQIEDETEQNFAPLWHMALSEDELNILWKRTQELIDGASI